jgi:hypothetical protein
MDGSDGDEHHKLHDILQWCDAFCLAANVVVVISNICVVNMSKQEPHEKIKKNSSI